jgi:membrane protease YdiL (CAAX protease family)
VWGTVATILWSVVIAIIALVGQVLVTGIYLLSTIGNPGDKLETALRSFESNGTYLSFCTFADLVVCVPLILGIVKLKRGANLNDYLGLKWPPLKEVLRWSLITLCFCLLLDAIFLLLRQPIVPEFMLKAYSSASPRWVLWLAVNIGAPIYEEICFRGFLFKGLAASRLRWQGATVISAVLWAIIHQQYDWYGIAAVFALGLLLGTARGITNSTLLTMWLHCLINLVATAQVAIVLRQL